MNPEPYERKSLVIDKKRIPAMPGIFLLVHAQYFL
jgi:hypothetical protein